MYDLNIFDSVRENESEAWEIFLLSLILYMYVRKCTILPIGTELQLN